jgi:hypothetical protein
MKTSNYIILSFFVFLFGGVFVLFLSAKIDPRGSGKQTYLALDQPLDSFSVVIAGPGANIRLRPGEIKKMQLIYPKGDSCIFPPVTVRNDTLFVSSYPDKKKQREVSVYCNGLKSIQEKEGAKVTIEKQFEADTLLVKLQNAEFSHFSDVNSPKRICLTLIADQSKINIGETNFDHLEIQLDQTEMNTWNNSINNLSGSIKNHSRLNTSAFNRINLDVDPTSNYSLYKHN